MERSFLVGRHLRLQETLCHRQTLQHFQVGRRPRPTLQCMAQECRRLQQTLYRQTRATLMLIQLHLQEQRHHFQAVKAPHRPRQHLAVQVCPHLGHTERLHLED